MPATYDPIATTTLGSNQGSIVFSSIPSTYTDLRLIIVARSPVPGGNLTITYNQQTGTQYSSTILLGDGSSATFTSTTNQGSINSLFAGNMNSTLPVFISLDIFSYTGSTNKSTLASTSFDRNGAGETRRQIVLWSNTSAINRIDIDSSGFITAGSIATLYGIKAA
jgi:hypothetical protein